jgi:hypothetical protein
MLLLPPPLPLLLLLLLQLVIVWAAADASHPSFSDAQRLAAGLWAQRGPKTPNPLAALRARAEASAAAAAAAAAAGGGGGGGGGDGGGGGGGGSNSSKKGGKSTPNPKARSSASSSSSTAQQQQQQPLLHSIWVNFQPHPDVNRVLGDSWQLMHGPETGWQGFGGVQLALQPGSFVQVGFSVAKNAKVGF